MFAALVIRAWRNHAYRGGWKERLGGGVSNVGGRPVWIHAASVGEVEAAAPLVQSLQREVPDIAILMTTFTPTGRARVTTLFPHGVACRYLPLDYPGAVRRFLGRNRPRLGVIVETELWPNLLAACRRARIPVMLVNGRVSRRAFAWYRRWPLIKHTLRCFSTIAARSADDAERLVALGADPAHVIISGNIKFDRLPPPDVASAGAALRLAWKSRPVWIAASTREGEDEAVLNAHERVRAVFPHAALILVPRHPERFAAVVALCVNRGYRVARRSRDMIPASDSGVFVGDTLGELPVYYAAADAAFIGGSLVAAGGHNPLEAAALERPVLVGPHTDNFCDEVEALLAAGAGQRVDDPEGLAAALIAYLGDEALRRDTGRRGAAVVAANRGATARVFTLLTPHLRP